LEQRTLGNTGIAVTSLGFGAFKIGRNQGIKYPTAYDLPDEAAVASLLNAVLDMGVNFIDTAPAYGLSEERIGKLISHRRGEFVLSTKVGETFDDGVSRYDFTGPAVRASLERSLRRLNTDAIDIAFIHCNDDDVNIFTRTDTPAVLSEFKARGLVRAVGMSAKTAAGFEVAMDWADVLMFEFNAQHPDLRPTIQRAHAAGKGVVIKKALASGWLAPAASIDFALREQAVDSVVVGGMNIAHMRANVEAAERCRPVGS
jgi:aryl-alcohol dehydrogenase-like predicted oxidoreductase